MSLATMPSDHRILIAHVIFRLDVGGLENGLVNIINGLPRDRFRHVVICIDDITDFKHRINPGDVELVAIGKKPGRDPRALWRIARTLRRLRPDIVHTRNLAGLDGLLPAVLAGVPVRIHSEHGWDVADVDGSNARARILRKLHRPLVHHFIALSGEIQDYLVRDIGIDPEKTTRLVNGVDTDRFCPSKTARAQRRQLMSNADDASLAVGTVGRLQPVKDPLNLVESIIDLRRRLRGAAAGVRLAIIGDGPLFADIQERLQAEGVSGVSWLPGKRSDIPRILQSLDVFVQPSRAEGISNTILEAMACGLPVIATDVGGNGELVVDGETGKLVPAGDPVALSRAIEDYMRKPGLRSQHGRAGRARALDRFTLAQMLQGYQVLYESLAGGDN